LLIARVRASADTRPLVLACAWVFLSMPGAGVIGESVRLLSGQLDAAEMAEASGVDEMTCLRRTDIEPLNKLPQGLMLNPIDLGTRILGFSHHSILASPYHRVERGMKDSVRAYLAPAARAQQIAKSRGVDYIIYCPSLAETDIFRKGAPAGLISDLEKNKIPTWLEPIAMPKGNTLKVYRVKD
jgi:hypothetical protein